VNPPSASYEQLAGICACLALALVAHLGSLPVWVLVAVAVSGGLRLLLARRGRPAPPRGVRLAIAALTIALLFLQFRTFNGLSAGTALLALVAGLKLLETETRRDIHFITLTIYFVCVSALLEGDSFWLLAYLIAVCWLTTATLLRLTATLPLPDWRRCLRYAGRILSQALPLALVFWLLFPRFPGPLWHLPDDTTHNAGSGLSDTMSPGDIAELALSDEVAFRVRFANTPPPPQERYWRGPVMHDFDGQTWTRGYPVTYSAPPLQPRGPAYRYTLSLEPHQHNWIFALDWPSHWDLPSAALTSDYTLVQPGRVSRPVDVAATSYTRVQSSAPLSNPSRQRDTKPQYRNPRTVQLAQTLRAAHPDDMEYVRAVLAMFTQQPFYYTLTPPKHADNSVDAFLFDTKRGFCGHYASAFAALMRAAGIPAHVVTGYHGGTFNRFEDYWILRQSDAHAWDEVWIEERGWLRVDPTSAIAPDRVEHGPDDVMSADGSFAGSWRRRAPWLADARLRIDALRLLWREQILFFDQDSQQKILEWLRIPEPDGQKLVMVLTAALVLVMCWLTWAVRREVDPVRREPLIRAYSRLCAKLAAAGISRLSHEGAEDYAARVAQCRPDLGPAVIALCRHYSTLRYAAAPARITVGQFNAAVRAFRPIPAPKPTRAGSTTPPDFHVS
jgi:protein-glutamine gamma-glutamyltransferase